MKVISGLLPETWGYFCMKNFISTTRNCHSHIHESTHFILFACSRYTLVFSLVWLMAPADPLSVGLYITFAVFDYGYISQVSIIFAVFDYGYISQLSILFAVFDYGYISQISILFAVFDYGYIAQVSILFAVFDHGYISQVSILFDVFDYTFISFIYF